MSSYHAATVAFERGDYQSALRDFELALAEHRGKDAVAIYSWIGICHYNLEQYDKARIALDEVLRNSTETPHLLAWLAAVAHKQAVASFQAEDYRSAADQFNLILHRFSDDESLLRSTLLWLGISYQLLGECSNALQTFEKVLKLFPDARKAKVFLCYILATAPDAELRDGRRAMSIAEELVEAVERSDHWSSLTLLAAASAEMGDFDRALIVYEQAIAIMPPENAPNDKIPYRN